MKATNNSQRGASLKENYRRTSDRLRYRLNSLLGAGILFGSICIADAGLLSGSVTPTVVTDISGNPTDLTALGASDWAYWGRANNYNNFDHKSAGGSQISDKSTFGSAISTGAYSTDSRYCTWTDGAPTASATSAGCIYENGDLNTGFQFTAPADPNARTLYVWGGGDGATLRLSAHLSDGSAADYVFADQTRTDIDGNPVTGLFNRLFQIDYQANSPLQTVTITMAKVADAYDPGNPFNQGSIEVWAAWLIGPPPPYQPPSVSITAPTNGTVFGSGPTNITITASASGNPAPVTNVEFYAETTLIGADSSSPYSIVWSNATPGTYKLSAKAKDNMGLENTSARIEVGVAGTGGQMSGAVTLLGNTPNTMNLTDLGREDWINWGRGGVYGRREQRSGGGRQISDVTPVGVGETHGGALDSENSRYVSFWNGWQATELFDDMGYIYANGPIDTGFEFTVAADTNQHTLYVYCGGSANTTGKLRAHLSDFSVSDYIDSKSSTGQYMNVYVITYKAGSAGQTLKISYLKAADLSGTGSVDLKAAWIVLGPDNQLPSVAFATPANDDTFSAGANIAMTAVASDSDGTVTNVGYYVGSVLVGSASSSPYSVTWNNAPTGRYILRAKATDNDGGIRISAPITMIVGGGGTTPVSDDFNRPSFNSLLWATMDGAQGPFGTTMWGSSGGYDTIAGGAAFDTAGAYSGDAYARITVPAGRNHDAWNVNDSVFMLQAVANQDFEVEAKFNNLGPYGDPIPDSSEGFLVEDDNNSAMRFEVLQSGGAAFLYGNSGIGSGAVSGPQFYLTVSGIPGITSSSEGGPAYARLNRTGDDWTFSTSPDGTNWTMGFTQTTVGYVPTRLGIHLINYNYDTGLPSPAFVAQVDYFQNTAAPIAAEDGIVAVALGIALTNNQAAISWPSTATGFALEATPSLSSPSWSAVTNPVVAVGGTNTVTVNITGSESYYRLRH